MPRIRTIKPEFWTSTQVVKCDPVARLFFVGLWSFADDQGVHPADILRAKMEIFPGDNFAIEDVESWVSQLIDAGLLSVFEAQGVSYWAITGWHHQLIRKPANKFPAPPPVPHRCGTSTAPVPHQCRTGTALPPAGREGKGKEGKVRDKRRKTPAGVSHPDGEKKKPGRRPLVTLDDVTVPDGLGTDAVRSALDDWLAHRRAIRKSYKTATAVDQLLKQWEPRGPTEFVDAVKHSIANEYQGLFSETNGHKRPAKTRFGPGQVFTPDGGDNDPDFGKL